MVTHSSVCKCQLVLETDFLRRFFQHNDNSVPFSLPKWPAQMASIIWFSFTPSSIWQSRTNSRALFHMMLISKPKVCEFGYANVARCAISRTMARNKSENQFQYMTGDNESLECEEANCELIGNCELSATMKYFKAVN